MPPARGQKERRWTKFELQTLLALMAKGAHLEGQSKKKEDPNVARRNAQLNFATELNKALHGDDFGQDIPRKEVARMLDKVLAERKHVVGRGGLMERQTMNRLTRPLKLAWESNRKMDFDGSISEWEDGRKLEELNKERATKGLSPLIAQDKEGEAEGEMWAAATAQRCLIEEQGVVLSGMSSSGGTQGGFDELNSLSKPPVRYSQYDGGYSQASSMSHPLNNPSSPFSAQEYIHHGNNIQFNLSNERSTANNSQHFQGDYNGGHPTNKLPAMLSPLKSRSNADSERPRRSTAANSDPMKAENMKAGSDADGEFELENSEVY